MDPREHYAEHLQEVRRRYEAVLDRCAAAGENYAGIVFHAGKQDHYHADDREVPFQGLPHFLRFAPIAGKEHLLLLPRGEQPRLVQVVPRDFWYEEAEPLEHPCMKALQTRVVESSEAAAKEAGSCAGYAYVGADAECAARLGIEAAAIEPARLMAGLDWERGVKTAYEVECIREAGRIAGLGHAAVRRGLSDGLSERELHAIYLSATGLMENQTPYTGIVGWDEHAAILHYQSKDIARPVPGKVFLIDAGATCHGYASDVTRSYARDGAHPLFVQALDRMDDLQRELVKAVRPGLDYAELHDQAQRGVAAILCDLGLVDASAEECHAAGINCAFLPHGLGHHLGLQVHDVGGRQISIDGGTLDPPAQYPFLRTTRRLEAGHVVTIEPGLYFIPMLLAPWREGEHASLLNWELIDQLIPCGGIRIEDDVVVTSQGSEDLTRPWIPGHRS